MLQRWGRRAVLAIVAALAIYWMAGWLSSDLDTSRAGPKPSSGGKVVVLLHGYGAPGDDLKGLADELSEALPDATFLVPEAPHRVSLTGRAWVPDFSADSRQTYSTRLATEIETTSKRVWEVIDGARKKGAECRDIYVGGFSQGGRMAAEVALRAPADCALGGLIVLSGGSMNEVELPPATGRPKMRVLVAHGGADRLIPIGKGEAIARHFAEAGHEVRWLRFDGPHTIAPEVRSAIPAFLKGEPVGTEP